jgi:hypothetical protein
VGLCVCEIGWGLGGGIVAIWMVIVVGCEFDTRSRVERIGEIEVVCGREDRFENMVGLRRWSSVLALVHVEVWLNDGG